MKKLISFLMALIAAALAANASAPVLAPPSRVLDIDLEACDVNQDGMVNISDISTWLNAARNGDFSSGRYDVNSDGIVNYIDYACIYYTITQDDTMPTEDQCDFDGNGKVNVNDWEFIFDAWKNSTNEDPFDLNHDGSVDYVDLGMMALLLAELDANASAPVLAFSESEIWLAPGESMEVHIVLQSMDEIVSLGQIGFNVYDPTRIRDNGVVLDDCYGDKHYFLPEYSSENSYANSGCTETGVYRIMFYDLMGTYGTGYWPLESFTGPVNVFAFTVHATEGWNDQYVTIELDKDWSYVISPSNDHNYFTEPMVLTVKNKAGDWPVTATPDITTEMTDDAVIVTATGDGEVKLYQDGIEVENPCVVPRTYVNQTILFGATAWDEGKLMSDMIRKNVSIPAHSYYIVGNAPFGDWDPASGAMMTPNGDGTYSYMADLYGTVWFVFASGLAADWETFNANYRYGPSDNNVEVGLDQWVDTPRGGNTAYMFTGSGDRYVFTFNPASMMFMINGKVSPGIMFYTVAGTPASVFGTEWDPSNTANDMVKQADGKFVLQKFGCELGAGTELAFKVTGNHAWGDAWPDNNYVVIIEESGVYDLTFKFDTDTKEVGFEMIMSSTIDTRTDAPVITAETTADAVIVTAIGNGEVKLYRNGVEVDNPCVIPRTDVDCTFTFTATCKEEGKLISDVVTMTVLVPAMEQPSGDGISVYVKADQAPYLYSWDSSGSLCGDWPGTRLYDIETINRVDYYVYHFDKDMVNVIFNNGGGSQTGDFTNITHDAYFIYNGSDLAYGLIPPQVYGNPTGEYAFYVNTDGWDQVYAEVNGHSYPMTKVGMDGAGFEVYKWEASGLNYTPTTITFNDGAGRGVQDAYGNIYSREYVKGGYYIYSFYQTYYIVRLDMVTTIVYDDSSQRPALEDCSITLNSSNDEWNGYVNIEFQISGTYFSQQARQGSVWYSIDGNEWVEFTSLLNSEQQFDETVSISFNSYNDYHSLRIIARDQSGAFSESVYLLQAVVDASSLECENLPYVEYTGQPITFVPQVYDINHNPCYVDQDFTYSFENNVDAGTALLNIQGIYPNCIGNATIEFTINPHTISGDVHTVGEWFYYTGSPITPEVIVTDAAFGTLIEGQDYVVTYENNNQVGTGRAIVDGIGNFDGHFVLEFEIIGIPGDVNYTGTVDITDLQAMVMYIFGEYNRPFNFTAADLNEDQSVNVQDVVGEANILLNGNQLTMSSGGRRMPAIGDDTQASLYWENGVLYLYSTVPVAALDIINSVDGDIKWSLGARGMVVVNAPCDEGEHSVIYSLSDGVIPAGLTAIATTTDQNATVVSAMLSDTDAELVSVKFNDSMTGLTGINSDGGVSCNMEGSDLVINSGAALRDVDVTIYSIDGRIVDNQHLSSLNSGRTKLDVSNVSDGNRYLIIVVRSGRQILATQKLTQNK